MLRRLLLLLLLPGLVLVGCGSDDDSSGSPLDAVEVVGDTDEEPTLEFDQPFSVTETVRKVLVEGDGDAVADGATAIFDFVFVNGRDGKKVTSSYDSEPIELVFNPELLGGVRVALEGLTAGSRALVAIAPEDGFGPQGGDPANGVEEDDTLLFVLDLHDVRTPLTRAEGTAVDPVDGLPTVELAADGEPTITVPEGEPPAELVAQLLIEGGGPEVESGQTITVHYTGVVWATGTIFDSSWTGTPASFPIGTGGVIPGWDKGLVGTKVGSQVLLVIPPADGYPDGQGDAIPPGSTLVFVVDILDAHG